VPGVSVSYGRYLARVGGCFSCHGENLAGGHYEGAPSDPPAQNITPGGIGSWRQADFMRALRTGRRPDGSAINPFMPSNTFANMTDDEVAALWQFVRTVPAHS